MKHLQRGLQTVIPLTLFWMTKSVHRQKRTSDLTCCLQLFITFHCLEDKPPKQEAEGAHSKTKENQLKRENHLHQEIQLNCATALIRDVHKSKWENCFWWSFFGLGGWWGCYKDKRINNLETMKIRWIRNPQKCILLTLFDFISQIKIIIIYFACHKIQPVLFQTAFSHIWKDEHARTIF